MSMFEDGSYGSLTGVALIGKVLAGRCGMKYTRAAVGNGVIPDEMTPKTMTGPAGYVMDAVISAVTNPIDGECQVTVQIKSDNVERGFYATNIVLYAEDPDVGEVPYTYLCLENEPEWIRPASSIVGKLATFDLIAAVGDVDAVTAVIDPESIITMGQAKKMFADHNEDPDAHGGIGHAKTGEIIIPETAWMPVEDGNGYIAEVSVPDAHENLYPAATFHPSTLPVAFVSGVSPVVQTTEGALRFWAVQKPSADMEASFALFFHRSGGVSSSVDNVPIASNDTLGGVKVQSDSGLHIDANGNLSLENSSTE